MTIKFTIELPADLLAIEGVSLEGLRQVAPTLIIFSLLRRGSLSQSRAAELLGICRAELFDLMSQEGVPHMSCSSEEVARDAQFVARMLSPDRAAFERAPGGWKGTVDAEKLIEDIASDRCMVIPPDQPGSDAAGMKAGAQSYLVHFHPAEEGGYTVIVPALEGVVTEGDSFEEAERNAREAIALHLETLATHGLPNPDDRGTIAKRVTVPPPTENK